MNKKNILFIILIFVMCAIILFFQTKKIGFHEDEAYTIASSVNPRNGLMTTIDTGLEWYSREYVRDYVTLKPINFFNLASVYVNQAYDNHPPLFYTAVHFSSILFCGQFSKYSVFVVNIIGFILSCIVIRKILKILDKEHLVYGTLIFYGLSMGTISMVIFQRMYMLLTFFILSYFYYSLKIYKNNFKFEKNDVIKLGAITLLGFLTQYYFAVYAFFIFVIMLIQVFRQKVDKSIIKKYIIFHLVYACIGILLFPPCIAHLFFSDRGLSNLGNGEYFAHFNTYLKHLAYAFSVNNIIAFICVLAILFAGLIYMFVKKKDRFLIAITAIPSILFFIITVKMMSFQELRYIMPMIPFVCIDLFILLDYIINTKYKNVIIVAISIILVSFGFIFSKPKFLYEDYKPYLDIANENQDKSFVYVYDNIFNHMQSIPEMMIYKKSVIINVNNDELKFVFDKTNFENEDSFILCIKSYMDNEDILNKIKDNTDFSKITELYKATGSSSEMISNNLYLVER